ncbi:MAG: hypothetical protein WCP97_03965 [bacterium]
MPPLPSSQPAYVEPKKKEDEGKAFWRAFVINLIIFLILTVAFASIDAASNAHGSVFMIGTMFVMAFMFLLNVVLGIIALIRRSSTRFVMYLICAFIFPVIGFGVCFAGLIVSSSLAR